MRYPDFYDQAPSITMYDPLARFLGAVEGGIIEYRYADAVKVAGHSCPTVASAWLMTARALEALYPKDVAERGAVRVGFQEDSTSGVTGVIANVVSLITGATQDTGFKGLAGRFDRRNLLFFNDAVGGEIRFTRKDSGAAVEVAAHLQHVPGDPRMRELMSVCVAGHATDEMQHEFGRLWQERVRRLLLDYAHDAQVITVRAV
jgi:formylmethanofuran dehydrogenase subunit E